MAEQLAYVIITPYSLHKSRTGGILSRLLSRTGLELAAGRMFGPSAELIKKSSEATISANDPQERRIQEVSKTYIGNDRRRETTTCKVSYAAVVQVTGE